MKRDPINFSIQVSARGNAADEIAVEDVAETATQCLSYIGSIFTLLSLADTDRLKQVEATNLSITLERIGELGAGLCDEAMMLIDRLEDGRKGGEQ